MRAKRTPPGLWIVILIAAGLTFASAGPAGAQYPGTNGRIAFDDYITGQIYAVNPDGTGLRQLTDVGEGEFASSPAWAPDGKHIAFASNMSGRWRLWIMDDDGRHVRRVARDGRAVEDFAPTYTPDGTRLLYTRCRHEPRPGCALFSIRTDGTDRQALTPVPFDAADFNPSFSPDGSEIAFTRLFANGIIAQIHVMSPDGSGLHAVTAPSLEAFRPDWSPDGQRITFSSNCCRLPSNVYIVYPDGTGIQRLTPASYPNNDFASRYSPDGASIVFASDRRYDDFCCSDLFVMDADGSGETRIRIRNVGVNAPAWGTDPPIAGGARLAGTTTSISGREAATAKAAWCRELPALLPEIEGCR